MFFLRNKFFLLPLSTIMLLNISPAHAAKQTKEKQQTIDIQSQYLLLDEKKGISKYQGKVLFTKDTLTIKADTVTLYFENEKLTKVLIMGSPADVQHEPDNEDKVHSQANEMEYFLAEEKLTLKGQAFVDQGNRHFSGEYIEYDTRQRTLSAAGKKNVVIDTDSAKNNQPNGRVHVIIGPTNDAENSENK